jgi:uncharacterized protein YegL
MSKPKTRIAIILDKSGSMAGTKQQTIEGLNEQIQQAKQRAKDQDLRCCLVTFDGEVYEHLWDVPAEKLVEASPEDYIPNGSTNWHDAVGYTIQKLLATATPDDKDTAYLVYVISDGQANVFTGHCTPDAVSELIEGTQGTGKWTYTYMGHNKAYLEQLARQTGVPVSNTAAWENKTRGGTKRAFQHQNMRLNKFLDERALGKAQSASYSAPVGAACADYTDAAAAPPLEAAAPDLAEVKIGNAAINLCDVVSKMAKYQNVNIEGRTQQYDPSMGEVALFSNTVGVKWGGQDEPAVAGLGVQNMMFAQGAPAVTPTRNVVGLTQAPAVTPTVKRGNRGKVTHKVTPRKKK